MAEEITNNVTDNQQTETDNITPDVNESAKTPTVDELMVKIAELQASNKKMEAEKDKLKGIVSERNSEVADWKRKFNSTLTEQQQAEEADKEAREAEKRETERLRQFEQKTLAEKRYLMQGMSPENAEKAAEYEIARDFDALSKLQAQIKEDSEKELRRQMQADFLKEYGQAKVGVGAYEGMTKEEIMSIKDPQERAKAIQSNLALF